MRLSSLASSALATLASATASPLDPAPSGARRRLLGHCFDEFGGHHTDDRADAAGSNGTDASAFGGTNWAAVETGVHADPLVVRLVYWLVYVLAAVVLLIAMLTIWPPPDRVFPRKRPALRVVPWCLLGRMLGYGVIDWREGRLTPFPRYFRERHEVLSLWLGDMRFITFRARLTHFFAGIACTASLSMGLTDLESGRVTGDFWLVQVWVFGALFVYEIVLGIALRVSAVGASERALAAPTIASARRIEREYFGACFVFSFACLACSITFVHVMDEGGVRRRVQHLPRVLARLRPVRDLQLVRAPPGDHRAQVVAGASVPARQRGRRDGRGDDGVLLEDARVREVPVALRVRAAAERRRQRRRRRARRRRVGRRVGVFRPRRTIRGGAIYPGSETTIRRSGRLLRLGLRLDRGGEGDRRAL